MNIGRWTDIIRAWVEGLVSALLWLSGRLHPPARLVIRQDDGGRSWQLHREIAGNETWIGRLPQDRAQALAAPKALQKAIKGGALRLCVPDGWIIERALDPVPARSLPFLDGYLRRQIERVTPWSAQDCLYEAKTNVTQGHPERLDVRVLVILSRLIQPVLPLLLQLSPRSLDIETAGGETRLVISVAALDVRRRQGARKAVVALLVATAVVLSSGLATTAWYKGNQAARLVALSQEIDAARRQAVTVKTRLDEKNGAGGQIPASSRPAVALSLDRLSELLPDYAYLTELSIEGDVLRMSGIASEDVAPIIPVIERSSFFSGAVFFAPTTKMEDQDAKRFFIEMRVLNSDAETEKGGAS